MDMRYSTLSVDYLERLYLTYLREPTQLSPEWREYFQRWSDGNGAPQPAGQGPSFRPASIFSPPAVVDGRLSQDALRLARLQERVDQLIRNYRVRGHIIARIDPLGTIRPTPPELKAEYYGFTEDDLQRAVSASLIPGSNVQTLQGIVDRLQDTYCGSIGAQFMHIDDLDARNWLQRRLENTENRLKLSRNQQIRILTKLTDAVIFEEFVRRKYVGAKTFSLEGAESLIPLLDMAIDKAAALGVREIVMGMSHRGRLNVLANIIGKSLQDIFREFEDVDAELYDNRGDVKYHLGHHNYFTTASGREVHVSLGFNPSHLEFVNPVTMGRARAKQDRFGDTRRKVAMVVLIHGDAAFAGEGVVQESLNMSELPGYTTGGALHIIVNNQLGFTTPPGQGRSSSYATDVAKMLQIPIFHVNGQEPEAVAQVVDLALEFRHNFGRDVVIDMYCYRRWGHNEGDEPAFTQPLMYKVIDQQPSVRESYCQRLIALGGVTKEEADEIAERRYETLEKNLTIARREDFVYSTGTLESMWEGYMGYRECFAGDVQTGVEREKLVEYLDRLTTLPEGFHLHKKLARIVEARREMAQGSRPLDWATAELLALASLAAEGYRVRMSGQDCERGTFSHRHAVLHDVENGETFTPLQHISADQAPVEIVNSPLSEAGVLGFEYGYSLVFPDGLVLWEAQFGDFANAAQVIIDQFIASAEDKWRHLSGLVMLLPHGFEGQGPEHSSARLERFLCLAAEDNIQVVIPSTPAQYFHCLRRQVVRRWRKPLVVLAPKSLLRHRDTVSPLEEFTGGRFQRALADPQPPQGHVGRVLLSSGKMYYELSAARQEMERSDVALLRLEEIYPLSESRLTELLKPYPAGTPVRWVQEEPENMGAWSFLRVRFGERLLQCYPFDGITRAASASPATGSKKSHRLEQAELIAQAFGEIPSARIAKPRETVKPGGEDQRARIESP
jgi:2-oxoglutarate dehydrogenase E1 component